MADEKTIRMRLRPFDAPTNVARFMRMVRSGWFEGRTLHRAVPNFVVQGGSPGANEYMGDGPFTRDELGLGHHVRGTVGISTRGRDTGDGQIFFNLIDNWRLDHDYTIIGEVVSGMDVVDTLQEGAVIARVTLIPDKP
jgi:cyclophilin family peptidyl-prolyl cis-trans isomerase